MFKDLFQYVSPHITAIREGWDGIQEDMKIATSGKTSHISFQNCKAACEADKWCFQFVHDGTVCSLSHRIRLGTKRSPGSNSVQRYTSGWMVERIQAWTEDRSCKDAHWVKSNP